MNKLSLFLVVSFLSTLGLTVQGSKKEIFPFEKNPELSWSQFEQNFRQQYADLNIPPFQVINDVTGADLDFGPAAYIHEVDQEWDDFVSKNSVDSKPPVIIVDMREITSVALTGYVLLHEIGHHNYDPAVRKQRKEYAKIANVGAAFALLAGNLSCLYNNCQSAWNRNFTLKKGLIQGSLVCLLLFKNETFGQLINNFLSTRPDEYFADSFANKHATLEMLHAAQYEFSAKGAIENYMHKEYPKEKLDNMNAEEQKNTQDVVGFVIPAFYSLSDAIDITAHPSSKKRHALIQRALKDRFNDEQSN